MNNNFLTNKSELEDFKSSHINEIIKFLKEKNENSKYELFDLNILISDFDKFYFHCSSMEEMIFFLKSTVKEADFICSSEQDIKLHDFSTGKRIGAQKCLELIKNEKFNDIFENLKKEYENTMRYLAFYKNDKTEELNKEIDTICGEQYMLYAFGVFVKTKILENIQEIKPEN